MSTRHYTNTSRSSNTKQSTKGGNKMKDDLVYLPPEVKEWVDSLPEPQKTKELAIALHNLSRISNFLRYASA